VDSPWDPSAQYQKVVEANIRTYAEIAEQYDRIGTCVVSRRCQAMLEEDIDKILQMLCCSGDRKDIYALDACGGSGNIALKLLDRGVKVVLCDVSPDLIKIFASKCKQRGYSAEIVRQEIGSFLSSTERTFDLIVFSSALHHIEDYTGVLLLSQSRLNKGGMIYTVFDGTKRGFLTYWIMTADYIVFAVLNRPGKIIPSIIKKFKRIKSGHLSDSNAKDRLGLTWENIGLLAEYYASSGIDDFALVDRMSQHGLEVIWHERYPDARYAFFRLILRLLGRPTSFKLLLRYAG
jgi:2-polyprenyl-3-methyl-5-hydroxy-6-metoxy-1,4-benzoquinol methylase